MHSQGLGNLQEADQLEPVQPVGAGLVPVHLRKSCIHSRISGDQSVDVGEPEEAAHRVHHRHDRGVHEASVS